MPIYEYKCENCGKVVEVLSASASGDASPVGCICGKGSRFVRLYSTFAALADSHSESHIARCRPEGCCGGACGLGENE